jgi:single-strand DNA-binding protein
MNKIVLLGNLVRDPELKRFEGEGVEKCCAKFTVAVGRLYKSADGTIKTDFIPVVIWGKRAEVIVKYMKKGDCISLSGSLRTRSYDDKDGNKKYIAEVIAEEFKFVGGKKNTENEQDLSEAQ